MRALSVRLRSLARVRKKEKSGVCWKRGHNEMDLVRELKDMTFLDWTEKKLSPGTPGCFLKAYEETEHGRVYYKLSNYDS